MYDLHTHSNFSDGTLPPEKLIEEAAGAGLTLIALTDHDTAAGVPRARAAAEAAGVPFITGIELEAEYEDQLHILGLGVDPRDPGLRSLIELQDIRREERNESILRLLARDGHDVRPFLAETEGTLTRANIARAMYDAGFVSSISEAFSAYLGRGKRYFVPKAHPSMEEVLSVIEGAGGVSVFAHPMNMRVPTLDLIDAMNENGLWGLEAYYGLADRGTVEYYASIADRFGLSLTCGSDFHGENRPGVTLGCSWRPVPELEKTEDYLRERFVRPRRRPGGPGPDEYQLMAERILEELPGEFFNGLNGGVVISEHEKLHRKSLPQRPLYVLGEYHYGGNEGRYITLYYGSFRRVHGGLSGREAEEELRRIILHEFRHHLETRAGEHDLEYEDDEDIERYLESAVLNDRPDLGFGMEERPTSTTYIDPFRR
ncbi:MAG: PHP domain-containing protein [Clostridia bacterium]|nr:PHP domain-containing protein [Clostridia bacterium]